MQGFVWYCAQLKLSSQNSILQRSFAITNLLLHHLACQTLPSTPTALQAQASASCNGDPTCMANADAAAKAACGGVPGCMPLSP
jgi:hypothetical protein